jgi:hypothetical protein
MGILVYYRWRVWFQTRISLIPIAIDQRIWRGTIDLLHKSPKPWLSQEQDNITGCFNNFSKNQQSRSKVET